MSEVIVWFRKYIDSLGTLGFYFNDFAGTANGNEFTIMDVLGKQLLCSYERDNFLWLGMLMGDLTAQISSYEILQRNQILI